MASVHWGHEPILHHTTNAFQQMEAVQQYCVSILAFDAEPQMTQTRMPAVRQ